MINFRYHVVSLVAVFLALAVGIVMGSTVIDRAIVDGLRNRIDTANKNTEEKRAENDQLKTSAKGLNAQNTVLAGTLSVELSRIKRSMSMSSAMYLTIFRQKCSNCFL